MDLATWSFLFLFFADHAHGSTNGISSKTLVNLETNELYFDSLLQPMIKELVQFVDNDRKKNTAYLPDDAALVQSIGSFEDTLFYIAKFFSRYHSGVDMETFEGGLGVQFESMLCDNVYSSKFPRKRNQRLPKPWFFFNDFSYFNFHCDMATRKKRSVKDMPLISDKRTKRNRRYLNTHTQCGAQRIIEELSGSLTFPGGNETLYEPNLLCTWIIKVPRSLSILVTYVEVGIEEDKKCLHDHVAFYEGSTELYRLCGSQNRTYPLRTASNVMLVKFYSDASKENTGFFFQWTNIPQIAKHPGFTFASTISIDQVGDLNIDKYDFESLPSSETIESVEGYKAVQGFKLKLQNPTTCPLESHDSSCYFETSPYIISRIISSRVFPNYKLSAGSIEVQFEHTLEIDLYEMGVYTAPKSCVTWDSNVKYTPFGAWSRRNGRIIETNVERTLCHFDKPGIYAVTAAVPPPIVPAAFRFSLSWYFGFIFAIVWIFITFIKLVISYMNIPEWLNMNQLLALLVFCGVALSGIHLELTETYCSILSFLLYYFGVSVFIWHLLKAAQFTGAFDKFFRRERNLYAFYLMVGWSIPLFISGMGGGAVFTKREDSQSCWMSLKGENILGYCAPIYLIVIAMCFLYYKGLKRTKAKLEKFNYPKLLKRAVRDITMLVLFLLVWITGALCIIYEQQFSSQYFFCLFLCITVVGLCLYAKQQRKTYERVDDDHDTKSKYEQHKRRLEMKSEAEAREREKEMGIMKVYFKKWRAGKPSRPLFLYINIEGLKNYRLNFCHGITKLVSPEAQEEDLEIMKNEVEVVKNESDDNMSKDEDENSDEIYTDSEEESEDSDDGKSEVDKKEKKPSLTDDSDDDSDNDSDDEDEKKTERKDKPNSKEPKEEPEEEPQQEPKEEPQQEPKEEPQQEPKEEPQQEPKEESQQEPKEEESQEEENKEDATEENEDQ